LTSGAASVSRPLTWVSRAGAAAIGLGVAVAAGVVAVTQPGTDLALILMGALAGSVLVALAYARFAAFVLVLLVIRASLDWTKAPSSIGQPTGQGTMTTAAVASLFLAAACLWLLVQFKTGRLVPPSLLSLAWLAFVGIALISAVAADRWLESLAEWGRIATAVGMLLVLQQLLGRGGDVRRVLVACFASAVIPLAFATYQVAAGGIAAGEGERVHATFAHANAFGFYLVLLLTMGAALLPHVRLRARSLLLVLLWLSAGALLVTYSRGSWVAIVVGLVVVGFLQDPRLIVLVAGVAAVVVISLSPVAERLEDLRSDQQVAGVEGNSLAWRLEHWGTVTKLADESPIIGIGPKMTQYVTDSAKVPHNDYLRAYVEMGILGVTAYAGIIVALIHTARKALAWAPHGLGQGVAVGFAGCVAAFLVFSVAENVMSHVVVLWYFVAFAAAAVTVSRQRSPTQGPALGLDRDSIPTRVGGAADRWG
jgi:putative inorganic carbon (hco3(-)) transporter